VKKQELRDMISKRLACFRHQRQSLLGAVITSIVDLSKVENSLEEMLLSGLDEKNTAEIACKCALDAG
jgi:hypothetical protein